MRPKSSMFDRTLLLGLLFTVLAAALAATSPLAAQVGGDPRAIHSYAYTLKHRETADIVDRVRPLLSEQGTVEEQPAKKTLVVRDLRRIISRDVIPLLKSLDQPPTPLRFDIRVLRAVDLPDSEDAGDAAARRVLAGDSAEVPPELAEKLRRLLRYDDYRMLVEAGVSSREGEAVTYDLGETYTVSFRSGTVLGGKRLRLEDFQIEKRPPVTANKGRRLEPLKLFDATLNLWMDRPLTLVAQDPGTGDALVISISCRTETSGPEPTDDTPTKQQPD